MQYFRRHLSLQAKISLVLVSVILPTFLIVTIAQNKLTLPILQDEIRQIGVTAAKTLATRVESARLLISPNPTQAIENVMQDILVAQPDIIRMDVLAKEPVITPGSTPNPLKIIASNIEDEAGILLPEVALTDTTTSDYKADEAGNGQWEIYVPIIHKGRDPRGPKRLIGMVHAIVSTNLITRITGTLWKTTASAAGFSVVILFAVLSYFLRKTIANDRLLRQAESQNLQLTEQLHETQRQLMNTEKLAVMGQLTASFAHEIGTPLNAIGGHLQLLKEEVVPLFETSGTASNTRSSETRLEVIQGQLVKIESIVKSFLQSTAKPTSQKQLVDPNSLVDKTLGIVTPRVQAMGIEIKRVMNREMGPVRIVPLDLEQVLLNLINNSLDSIQAKKTGGTLRGNSKLEIVTEVAKVQGKDWAQLSIYDTGEGIRKMDLKNVLKPFFTTKRPGEGTGLGLTICHQLVQKYGGDLIIDSKEGAWTRVMIRLPYHATS